MSDQVLAILGGICGGLGVVCIGIGTGSLLATLGAILLALYGAAVLWALPRREYERDQQTRRSEPQRGER